LLLLHGYPFDHSMWRPQIRDLGEEARIVAPDLRGLGQSEVDPDEVVSMATHAQDAIGWMDAAGVKRAIVAGLSMGGYIAFEIWRQARERVAGLVLLDTKAEPDSPESKEARDRAKQDIARGGMQAVLETTIERALGKTTRATNSAVVEHMRRMVLSTKPEGAISALGALRERPSSIADLPGISVPVIIVVGDEDELTPIVHSQTMATAIPGADLRIVAQSGHVSSLEAPAEVTHALRDMLNRVPAASWL
ncbi:MAG TPA: alpha/beta hydrolase, partial [bacterium]|nr:alpha/beta hydrolase [bacterium]